MTPPCRRFGSMRYGKECVCGRGAECKGVSAAFSLLKDPRRGYVALPPYTPFPEYYEDHDMNAMRASYLRHLGRSEESLGDSAIPRYVALHHFHPIVVQKHSEMANAVSPIPKTVKKVDLRFLKMKIGDEDRVRNERGHKIKKFYFVPTISLEESKEDLKHIIRVSRLYAEAKSGFDSTPAQPLAMPPPGQSSKENGISLSPSATGAALQSAEKPPSLPPPHSLTRSTSQLTATISNRAGPDEISDCPPSKPGIVPSADNSVASQLSSQEPDQPDPFLDLVVDTSADSKGDGTSIDCAGADKSQPQNLSERIYDTIWPEEKLPSNVTMESEEGRQFIFTRIRNFEAYRSRICVPIIDEFNAQWRACLMVMQAGIFETARAERLIRGNAMANKAYSEAMQAMYEDIYLDEEGQVVSEARKQKKLAQQREGVRYSIASVKPAKSKDRDAHSGSLLLEPLVDSQAVLAEKFAMYGDVVTQEVVSELSNLRSHLKTQILEFKKRGDPLIRNIQDSEAEILGAFCKFISVNFLYCICHN